MPDLPTVCQSGAADDATRSRLLRAARAAAPDVDGRARHMQSDVRSSQTRARAHVVRVPEGAHLYDRKTPLAAADLLNDRVVPFFEEHVIA
jgi:hypothetical protein